MAFSLFTSLICILVLFGLGGIYGVHFDFGLKVLWFDNNTGLCNGTWHSGIIYGYANGSIGDYVDMWVGVHFSQANNRTWTGVNASNNVCCGWRDDITSYEHWNGYEPCRPRTPVVHQKVPDFGNVSMVFWNSSIWLRFGPHSKFGTNWFGCGFLTGHLNTTIIDMKFPVHSTWNVRWTEGWKTDHRYGLSGHFNNVTEHVSFDWSYNGSFFHPRSGFQSLALFEPDGYGLNGTNRSISCNWNCYGDCRGCSCWGSAWVHCCNYGNNVTRCKFLNDQNRDLWEQWFLIMFLCAVILLVFVILKDCYRWCFGKRKTKNKREWRVTDGHDEYLVSGWVLIFVLFVLGIKPVRSVKIGPDDMNRWFANGNNGFKVVTMEMGTSGHRIAEKCCEWKGLVGGAISCCVDVPSTTDVCEGSTGNKWDCVGMRTGTAGWNDGCWCEYGNVVTWCCTCHCLQSWTGYQFDFSFGKIGVVIEVKQENLTAVVTFNETGTLSAGFVNVTLSGCETQKSVRAWSNGDHWADAGSCTSAISGRPLKGAVGCHGYSNWGRVVVDCQCPAPGEVNPLSFAGTFSGFKEPWVVTGTSCDVQFKWSEQPESGKKCKFWCGDMTNTGWCEVHVADENCTIVGHTPGAHSFWTWCGNDGEFMGKKCNGTKFEPPAPGPFNPEHQLTPKHDTGFRKWLSWFGGWFYKYWFYFVIYFVVLIVYLLFKKILK